MSRLSHFDPQAHKTRKNRQQYERRSIYMKRRRSADNRKTFQALALISQLGITMIVSIGMASALGIWLDRKLGTSWITVVMFVLGTAAGIQSAWRLIRKIYDGEERQDKERDLSGEDHRSTEKER